MAQGTGRRSNRHIQLSVKLGKDFPSVVSFKLRSEGQNIWTGLLKIRKCSAWGTNMGRVDDRWSWRAAVVAEVQECRSGPCKWQRPGCATLCGRCYYWRIYLMTKKAAEGTGTGKNTIALTFIKIKIYPCWLKKNDTQAGKMAQWLNCLLCKCANLHLDPLVSMRK